MSYRFSHPSEALVDKNLFRQLAPQPVAVPDFAATKPHLPVPVLPEDTGWVGLYWNAWQLLWSRLTSPPAESSFVTPIAKPAPENNLQMGVGAFLAQLSGYSRNSAHLIAILDNFYVRQHADGFIGRELDPTTGEEIHPPFEPNSTGPGLLAWAEWRYYRWTGDVSRLEKAFWPMMAYHRWCRNNRTWPNGLYWTTGYSSGLINQPRVPDGRFHHKHWTWIDASAQAFLDATLLELMAVLLGEQALADEMANERASLGNVINTHLWNEDQLFFQDLGPDGRFSPVKSIAAYWTLLSNNLVLPDRQTPFIQHLRDSWSFRGDHCLPSLSADSESYNSRTGNGWRGAVWSDLTYMVLRGLNTSGQTDLAHALAVNHVETVCRVYEDTGFFWENYAPEVARPGDPSEPDRTGLTAAGIIGMIMEFIIGIKVDWTLRRVVWHRHLTRDEPYGVRNLPLGNDGTLDLIASADRVRIRTDAPLTLELRNGREISTTAVPSGEFEFVLD